MPVALRISIVLVGCSPGILSNLFDDLDGLVVHLMSKDLAELPFAKRHCRTRLESAPDQRLGRTPVLRRHFLAVPVETPGRSCVPIATPGNLIRLS